MWRIPLSDLNFDETESIAVQQVLRSGWLTMGPRTEEFESAFCAALNASNAVAVANCTCALELTYRYILSTSAPEKRAIVVPDITFVATANAVVSAGGTPLICDVDSSTQPFLSPTSLEKLLSSRSDIAAVSLVHYAGYDANSESIAAICHRHKIMLVEDCAHSPGATSLTGRMLGTVGFAGCFSFFSNKNMATGEGGMIVTAESEFAAWARAARSHGMTSGTWNRHTQHRTGYDVTFPGYNYRCTEITAALGLAQLEKLEAGNQKRHDLTHQYRELLQCSDVVSVLDKQQDAISACHILALICSNAAVKDKIRVALTENKIQTSNHYSPIHSLSWYTNQTSEADYPNSTAFANHEITLPLYPNLKSEQVEEICAIVLEASS